MANALNLPSDCCTPCDETVTVAVPGPAGAAGAAGTNGTNGVNAFTTLSANFTMPASLATGVASVGSSDWASIGQIIYLQGAGWLKVTAKPTAVSITLQNLENGTAYSENVAGGTIIASGSSLSPGGLQGPDGASGSTTLNAISPTTTKGDLMVDNGALSPAANVVRYGVGTNGQLDVADSTTATGHQWKTLLPSGTATVADTDNRIVRFNAPAGSETPAPVQVSGMVITDTGAIQSTGTGGNARGASATDLQVIRTVGTQVASGANSALLGGTNNTASGARSVAVAGDANSAIGIEAVVLAGSGNIVNGDSSVIGAGSLNQIDSTLSGIFAGATNVINTGGNFSGIVSGNANTVSALNAFIGGGSSNEITSLGEYGGIVSGLGAKVDKYGQMAHASGQLSNFGDAQRSNFVLRSSTTDATPTTLFLDGTGGSKKMTLASNTSWTFRGLVVGRRDNGDTASWSFTGGIHNNGGTTALIAAVTATLIATDAGASATWGVAGSISVTADNTNDALNVGVTGTGGNNIRWVCHVDTVEVTS